MNSKRLSITISLCVLILISTVVYIAKTKNQNPPPQTTSQPAPKQPADTAEDKTTDIKPSEPQLAYDSTNLVNTTGWKTYHNDIYDYTIKYPANWEIIPADSKWGVQFSPIGEDYYIEGEPETGVINIADNPTITFDPSNYANAQKVMLDGRLAYKTPNGYWGVVSIDFSINSIPISLVNYVSPAVINSDYKVKVEEYNRVFNTMLSTFEFGK